MSGDRDKQFEPVCKFGPGGQFVSFWPADPAEHSQRCHSSLTHLLNKLARLIAAPLAPKAGGTLSQVSAAHHDEPRILRSKEEFENAVKDTGSRKPPDAPKTTIIKSDSLFSGEPMLLPNDSGTRERIRHKPKHRVRTYRRAAKKRPAPGVPGQGSLFETHFKSARTA